MYLGLLSLCLLAFGTTVDVIGRYLFNRPLRGMPELTELMMAIIIFASLAYTTHIKKHVSIDLFYSKASQRVQAVIDVFGSILGSIMFGLVAWKATDIAFITMNTSTVTDSLRIPMYPFRFSLVIAAAITCLIFALQGVLASKQIIGKKEI